MTSNRWKRDFNAIGIIPNSGKYKGTFTHPDIAFEFADAVKTYIVPTLIEVQKKFVYAEEADVLNVALFAMTAKEWRDNNPELAKEGNMRDYTDLLHLVILNNLQNTNAELIEEKVLQNERLISLNNSARRQMKVLKNNKNIKELELLQKQVNEEKELLID